jgi:hypothetical protein
MTTNNLTQLGSLNQVGSFPRSQTRLLLDGLLRLELLGLA